MSKEQDNRHLQMSRDAGRDPVDGQEPVPLWLVTLFGVLLAWGGWYVGTYAANFRWLELDPEPAAHGAASQPAEDPLALGKRLYMGNCVSCHQADGKGVAGQYPPLAGSEWVNGNPAWMKRIVNNGFEGPVTVMGQQYNNAMPAFGGKFSDKQMSAVISFVRTNAEWGNRGGPVSIESVAATKAAIKSRTAPWSESELHAVKGDEAPAATSGPSSAPSTVPAAASAPSR